MKPVNCCKPYPHWARPGSCYLPGTAAVRSEKLRMGSRGITLLTLSYTVHKFEELLRCTQKSALAVKCFKSETILFWENACICTYYAIAKATLGVPKRLRGVAKSYLLKLTIHFTSMGQATIQAIEKCRNFTQGFLKIKNKGFSSFNHNNFLTGTYGKPNLYFSLCT